MLDSLEGDIVAKAYIVYQGHLELLVDGTLGMHRVNCHEGGSIRRVGHHTDHKVAVVAGAELPCPEVDLQGGNVQQGIHGGHDGITVASGGSVEVEAVAIVMTVRSVVIDVGPVGRAAQLVPATGERAGTSAVGLEVLRNGQRVNVGTWVRMVTVAIALVSPSSQRVLTPRV